MQNSVLLSIKPEFAFSIFDGNKKFEFRKAIFRTTNVKKVVVYASSPVQKVIGEFTIDEILTMGINSLWETTALGAGIEKSYFSKYFEGRQQGYALKVKTTRKYRQPLSLQEDFGISHPPQSFCYI
jgi:predicted transcriptional regulator